MCASCENTTADLVCACVDGKHKRCRTHYDPDNGHFVSPVHSGLLKARDYNVLMDTCMGNHKSRPVLIEMHILANCYLERTADCGISLENIDYVLCTRLHVNHVG